MPVKIISQKVVSIRWYRSHPEACNANNFSWLKYTDAYPTKYNQLWIGLSYFKKFIKNTNGQLTTVRTLKTAAWLAQLVERQSAVREVEGSSPRPDQHSGS